ncbi:MAG: cytochrome c biogenesis protein CcdA [Lachnospiraceae bacterium]|nr:cytochrome c biogenesis protein CcdA [Lachnospiraceae bacterium]
MDYFIAFLEGIITFVSPCLLPMLPIYISYFMGDEEQANKRHVLKNAFGFILGFTFVFLVLGAFAGSIGHLLVDYNKQVQILSGIIIILFGLNFTGFIKIPLLNKSRTSNINTANLNFGTSFLFGSVFSISWTPCVGAFLGSALMMASTKGSFTEGMLMLLLYSIGLGIPFFLSALLLDRLKQTFDFIKKHYRLIHLLSGGILIIVGLMMITGTFGILFRISL